ncbi:MAG TPA: CoA-binding protein, partial [Candidatus Binatia bacterium]
MAGTQTEAQEVSPAELQHKQIAQYWAGDSARRLYLLRRQRKAILENCRRIAVVGASSDPNSPSYIAIEGLLGLGLEIVPIFTDQESFLGVRCFQNLRDVPGKIDIVQIYPNGGTELVELARAVVDKGVTAFWVEQGVAGSREVEDILASGHVQLVEYESL